MRKKNKTSHPSSGLSYVLCLLGQDGLDVEKGKTFYDFQFNTRLVRSTIVHFQVATYSTRIYIQFFFSFFKFWHVFFKSFGHFSGPADGNFFSPVFFSVT